MRYVGAKHGGEWWRLATPMLLHNDPVHLLSNVRSQLSLGLALERNAGYGPLRTLLVYVLSGIGGNALAAVVEGPASGVRSAGASGAV